MVQEANGGSGWIGIPSVPPERVGQALASFLLAVAAATAVDVLLIRHNHGPEVWQLTAERVFDDGSSIVAWALAATWPLMEAMRMVIAGVFEKWTFRRGREQGLKEGQEVGREQGIEEGREQGIEEGREVGREEGREETQQLWETWLSRRRQAEARGEPFTEPPPGTGNGAA